MNEETSAGATPARPIQDVQDEHTPTWMAVDGVTGTGIGLCEGTPCIRIFLARESDAAREALPDTIEGHPVQVVVTGEFTPRDSLR